MGIGILGTCVIARGAATGEPAWHALLEGRAAWFSGFTVIAVLVGGVAEIVPSIIVGPARARRAPRTCLTARSSSRAATSI